MKATDTQIVKLFDPQIERMPDYYPWAQTFIEAMQDGFWTAKKFTFDSDVVDFKLKLTDHERRVVTRVLAAIAQIEISVKEFWKRLGDHLPHPSIKDLGITMAYVETIHNNAYEKLLKKLGLFGIFREIMQVPALAGRVVYLNKHAERVYPHNQRKQYIYSLILFTLFVENVSLFAPFYVILRLNRNKNVLKDTSQQVKYTRNEELLHGQAGSKIINTLREQYPELFDDELLQRVKEETEVTYTAECNLIDWMLDGYEAPGLNADILKSYVRERLNESLIDIGYSPTFDVSLEQKQATFWMTEGLLAPTRVDFFNSEPTSYTQADAAEDDDF